MASEDSILHWRKNPIDFVRTNFQVEPDEWQAQGLAAFVSENPDMMRISLQACAGPGKSTLLAWCGWLFLSCYGAKGEHPKAAAISVTGDNLKDNLWSEMAKWQGRSEFLMKTFKWTAERIYCISHPETWFMSARSTPKTADEEERGRVLSGLHSKYILYLIDESGDISPSVLKSAEQGLSTGPVFGKIMQAGNPTSQAGMLYAAANKLRTQWHVIKITGDPDDRRRSPRINIEWAREQINLWGRDNPWVMSFILGDFPNSIANVLLGIKDVEDAIARHVKREDYEFSQKRLGIDVARFGDDRTFIFPRQGLAAFRPVEMRNARNPEIAARVALAKAKWGSEVEFVDGTGGFGAGVIDALLQAGHTPIEIHFSSKADSPQYFNKRSEMWFRMSQWFKRGGSIPDIPGIIPELTEPTYTLKDGKILLEPKEFIKKRIGKSPDIADALALTFAWEDMPAEMLIHPSLQPSSLLSSSRAHDDQDRNSVKHEYDPFSPDRL